MSEEALQAFVDRHLEHAAMVFMLDDELGTHHGLTLEKTGLVERAADGDGKRRVTLRPQGRRLLHEARDTAANACAP